MSNASGLFCQTCGSETPESHFQLTCVACGGRLEVRYDLDRIKHAWPGLPRGDSGRSVLHQWLDLLPIERPDLIERVSLGEQTSPLIRSSRLGKGTGLDDLRFKLEYLGPTLSLKDRGTSMCALKALELGFHTLCIPSSGNNAASVAAYAAKAGLSAVVFIQRDVSPAKVLKILAHGAKIVRVDGDMSAAGDVCRGLLKSRRWLQCGGANPYRFTAKRTVAYEIVHQLDGRVPDAVVFPVGGATGIASAHAGFQEMVQLGVIPSAPRLLGVQLAACDPITRAFDAGTDELPMLPHGRSVSDALLNAVPFYGVQALRAARATGGAFVTVSDEECVTVVRRLAREEGLFVEPAGGVSVAGLLKLAAQGRLEGVHSAVCMLTGHGLNVPTAAFGVENLPDPVAPNVAAAEAYLDTL
ncbi:MAG: threonine synthase [Acidobacteria bacterium]|nr:threonine synthase [Acidobacteriota bacterium]